MKFIKISDIKEGQFYINLERVNQIWVGEDLHKTRTVVVYFDNKMEFYKLSSEEADKLIKAVSV